MVRGTRRQRPERPTGTIRLLMTGLVLAFSTNEVAYQDAISLLAQDVTPAARWQTRLVAGPKSPNGVRTVSLAGAARRPAADVTGPDDLIIVQPLDPVVTGSLALAASSLHRVNRAGKADLLVLRPQDISAGYIKTVALFAPVEAEQNLPRTAFVLPHPATTAFAALATDATAAPANAKAPAKNAKARSGDAKGAPPVPAPVVIAYASTETDDSATAPFDALIATPKLRPDTNIVVPGIGANHAWVNSPLPVKARSESEVKCLATAIYFEARGEPEKGQLAVAQVVLNRLKNPAYPSTICGVVYQNKNKRHRCQFSFACDGIRDRIADSRSWAAAQALATKVVNNSTTTFLSNVGASTHYHATYVRPRWARHMKKMDKIGRHIFYQTYGGGWS